MIRGVVIFLLLGIGAPCLGAIHLPPQFSDNMVLQRGKLENRIWGTRTTTERVWVEFRPGGSASKKFKPLAASDDKEFWEIDLKIPDVTAEQASAPGAISIWEAKKVTEGMPPTVILTNVVIGDVWLFAIAGEQGMSGPPNPSVQCRLLQLSDPGQLQQPLGARGGFWNPSPSEMHIVASEFALHLSTRRSAKGFPVGFIQVAPDAFDGFLKSHFPARRAPDVLPDLAEVKKFAVDARQSSNRRINTEAKRIEADQIRAKHESRVSPPSRYKTYGEFEILPGPGELKRRLLNFEGAIRPVSN